MGQYLSLYAADYQKYMSQGRQGQQGGQSGQTGGYQQYMKDYAQYYEKYMKQGSERIEGNTSNTTEFMDQYAGDYIPHVSNASDSAEWSAAFQKKYAGEYMAKYAAEYKDANTSSNGEAVKVKAATACHTLAELDAWRKAQLAKTHFVPGAYRAFARDSIQREYGVNRARIIKEQAETQNKTAADEGSSDEASTKSSPGVVQRAEATPMPELETGASSAVTRAHKAAHSGTVPLDDATMSASNETLTNSRPGIARQAEATPMPEPETGASSAVTKAHKATHSGTVPSDDATTLADSS